MAFFGQRTDEPRLCWLTGESLLEYSISGTAPCRDPDDRIVREQIDIVGNGVSLHECLQSLAPGLGSVEVHLASPTFDPFLFDENCEAIVVNDDCNDGGIDLNSCLA